MNAATVVSAFAEYAVPSTSMLSVRQWYCHMYQAPAPSASTSSTMSVVTAENSAGWRCLGFGACTLSPNERSSTSCSNSARPASSFS